MFLTGLQQGGVPIKFSSWHTFIFNTGGANVNLLVQERSRSVKALFAVQRRSPPTITSDSHAFFYDTYAGASTLQSYQWRIGGRYFPAAPVQCALTLGAAVSNGGAEAFIELEKALNVVGDYRLSTGANAVRWAIPAATSTNNLPEYDYTTAICAWSAGRPTLAAVTSAAGSTNGNCFAGNQGSGCFAMAVDLETSNGIEISGLNAEEQSDIALIASWSNAQASGFSIEVYTYYDAMIVLRENNVLELIQ